MLKGINPGELDRRVTIQSRTTAANAYNEPIETWTDVATVWAKVEYPLTGSDEETVSGLNLAMTRTDFTIRYRSDVNFITRVVYNSEYFDVERISEIGRNSFLKLTTQRRK